MSKQAQQAPIHLSAALVTASASKEDRTINGEIVTYGVVGYTSMGPTIFEPGSIRVHSELSRVKLLEMHDMERSLGYMSSVQDSTERLKGSFKVAPTPEGDRALEAVTNQTRDALSLGVNVTEYAFSDDGTLIVKGSDLNETSLVTVPAFSESRVSSISAAREAAMSNPNPNGPTVAPVTEAPKVEAAQVTAPVVPAAPVAPAVQATQFMAPPQIHAGAGAGQGVDLDTLARQITAGIKASGASLAMGTVLAKANPPMFMTAELTDVVPADEAAAPFTDVARPKWLGELWQAKRTERPTIDSLGKPEKLTSLKATGYQLVRADATKFMNKYPGGKADVPKSGKWKTAPAETTAERYAGGWDVDRAYFDFNDHGFIKATIQGAYEDYLMDTEADVLAKLMAAATASTGADVLEILTKLGADAGKVGATLSKIQFGSDMWAQLTSLTTAEVPWWLQQQGKINLAETTGNAGGLTFNLNHELAAGAVEAHDRRAATFYETPMINVQAQDIGRGGVDLGVFGYAAVIINDKRAIFKGTVAPGV
ncbi:major capsid and protease fusion protein [Arthrobacter phage Atraxa]|uniref:Major capsid and protease fusion protein n=1 Tax=Arthrobacter phage Atraxa TaxID=2419947 RepID=A0A3G2KDE4_9CAUD|nr:major head protein [Arthrobacter phage Atraxa]AYN56961.1 major capsid and protease fusion protein [Arthrobacter phage Atraxa]AYN59069.1 major capsid and protease fusion protein [Arthrobacter phage Sputnik]